MAKLSVEAWHGTGATGIDRLSLQYIGTGEGAQVHGYGLYFAQNRDVSEGYRTKLSRNEAVIDINGKLIQTSNLIGSGLTGAEYEAAYQLFLEDGDVEAAIDSLSDDLKEAESNQYRNEIQQQHRDAIALLKDGKIKISDKSPGSLFQVEIPDEDVMLDEQKTLSEQSEKVQRILRKWFLTAPRETTDNLVRRSMRPDEFDDLGYYGLSQLSAEECWKHVHGSRFITGKVLYESFRTGKVGETWAAGDKGASEALNSLGIKGITYEGGRDGRCYVVFDDQAIDIIERFSAEALSESEIRRMMMEAKVVDNEKLTPQQRKLSALGKELGSPVIWMDGDSRLHGWHQNGFTFLNVNSKADLEKTFWHETFHWIRSNNKQDYKKIVRYIQRYSRITKEQMDKWRKKTGRFDLSDEDVIEEMLCDSFYDAAGRVKELRTLANNNPSLAQRVMAWIKRLADRFNEFMHGREGGLTTSQRDNLTRVVGKLAATMKDGKGRPIFGVYRNGTEIRLANGQPIPAVSFSASGKNVLDNSENIGDNKNNQTSIGDRITVHENGSISIRLKYQPKSHETQKARLERRKAEIRDIDTALVKNGDRSAYVNLVPKRNKEAIDSAIARGVNPVDIAHNYRLRYNKELANYSDSVPEGKKIEMLLLLKGAELYATGKSRLHNDTGGSGGVSRSSDARDIGKVGAKGTSENSITKDDKHSSGSASSMPKMSASIGESEQSFLDKAFERFGKSAGVKAGKIIVEERGKDKNDIGLADYIAGSPSRIAEKVKMFRSFFTMGDKAMNLLTKYRSDYARKLEQALDFVEKKEDREALFDLLLSGDAEGKEYTREQLASDGVNEDVAEAYVRIRRLMNKAYRMVNDAKRRARMHTKRMTQKQIDALKENKFVEIRSEGEAEEDGRKLVSYKEYANWEKTYTVDEETLERFKKDDAMQVLETEDNGNGNFTVKVRESVPPVNKLTGYIPHFFHDYMIRVKDADGNYVATIGSGKTQKDAIQKADEWLKKNQLEEGQQIFISPKVQDFTQYGMDEGQYAAIMGDTDFDMMMESIAKRNDLTLKEAKDLMDGSVRKKNRHRFFGNLMHRKGVDGYEKDLNWVLRHYFNSASRYAALESEFKPKAISLFERYFGDFSKDHTGLAKYTKDYINDINGNPTALEEAINKTLNKSEVWNKLVVSNFGDRAALQLSSSVSNWTSMLCLGYLNASSALLNFSQAINATAYLGSTTAGGNIFRYGFKRKYSLKEKRVLLETNVMNDIGLDAGSGYDINRGYAGKAFGVLGKISNKGMVLFKASEGAMRRGTVLAAYDKAIKDGKTHAQAIEYAKEINRKSNFDYGVTDAPNIFRRGSIVSQLALQFKKYAFKEVEVMGDMLPMLSKSTNRKQKLLFWGMYFLACGLLQVPALDWLDKLLGENLKDFAQKSIMEVCGDSEAGKAIGKIAMYGMPSISGVDISNRAGMADVVPSKPTDVFGPALNKIASFVADMSKGDHAAALRDVSPGLYNQYAAWIAGESTGTRGRVNSRYDDAYSKILKSVGFKSTDERIASDIQRIYYNDKSKLTKEKQAAVDAYIEDPTNENAKRLKELGVSPATVKKERARKNADRKERVKAGMNKDEKTRYQDMLKFAE